MYLTKLNEKDTIDINKETNVLSYFIIRNEIYKRINVFLKYCKIYNEDYIKIKDKNNFFNFLKKNETIQKKNKRFNNINKNDYIFKTLRMSLSELSIYADANFPSLLG